MALLQLNSYSGEAEVAGVPRRITVDSDGLHIHGVSLEEASDLLRALGTGELRAYQPAGVKSDAMEFAFTLSELGKVEAPKALQEQLACECKNECGGHQKSPVAEKEKSVEKAQVKEPEPEEKPTEQKAEEEKAPSKRRTRSAAAKPATKKSSVVDDMTKDPEETVTGSPDDPEEVEDDDAIIVDAEEETEDTTSGESEEESTDAPEEPAEEPKKSADGPDPLFGQLLAATTMREVIIAFQDHGIVKLGAIQKEALKYQEKVPLLKNAGAVLSTRLARTAKGMNLK